MTFPSAKSSQVAIKEEWVVNLRLSIAESFYLCYPTLLTCDRVPHLFLKIILSFYSSFYCLSQLLCLVSAPAHVLLP